MTTAARTTIIILLLDVTDRDDAHATVTSVDAVTIAMLQETITVSAIVSVGTILPNRERGKEMTVEKDHRLEILQLRRER